VEPKASQGSSRGRKKVGGGQRIGNAKKDLTTGRIGEAQPVEGERAVPHDNILEKKSKRWTMKGYARTNFSRRTQERRTLKCHVSSENKEISWQDISRSNGRLAPTETGGDHVETTMK